MKTPLPAVIQEPGLKRMLRLVYMLLPQKHKNLPHRPGKLQIQMILSGLQSRKLILTPDQNIQNAIIREQMILMIMTGALIRKKTFLPIHNLHQRLKYLLNRLRQLQTLLRKCRCRRRHNHSTEEKRNTKKTGFLIYN